MRVKPMEIQMEVYCNQDTEGTAGVKMVRRGGGTVLLLKPNTKEACYCVSVPALCGIHLVFCHLFTGIWTPLLCLCSEQYSQLHCGSPESPSGAIQTVPDDKRASHTLDHNTTMTTRFIKATSRKHDPSDP